mgnify:FL=1|tara:strand:+ start:59 stop:493 length:435 start_codon:yes stop_codon:yes gene_type:complete
MKNIKNSEIKKLIKNHKYFFLPYLLKLSGNNDNKYNDVLNSLSIRHPKREILKGFISNNNINVNNILSDFIKNQPKISKSKKRSSTKNLADERITKDEFITENLAKIYIKQNKIKEAIKIYKKLISNNSKKKSYFAKKIEKLKR